METKKNQLMEYHQKAQAIKFVNNQIDEFLLGSNCDSSGRFGQFWEIAPELKGENYWHGLSVAYQYSDDLYPYKKEVKKAFKSREPNRECLMTTEEQTFLKNLPQKLVIYRGMTLLEWVSGDFGVSWTLNRSVAEKFAKRKQWHIDNNKKLIPLRKMVHKITIDKKEVIAYFKEREESEIIYLPQKHLN